MQSRSHLSTAALISRPSARPGALTLVLLREPPAQPLPSGDSDACGPGLPLASKQPWSGPCLGLCSASVTNGPPGFHFVGVLLYSVRCEMQDSQAGEGRRGREASGSQSPRGGGSDWGCLGWGQGFSRRAPWPAAAAVLSPGNLSGVPVLGLCPGLGDSVFPGALWGSGCIWSLRTWLYKVKGRLGRCHCSQCSPQTTASAWCLGTC